MRVLLHPLKKITPHKLRSTYGTSLYRETGDIYLVASVLGHSDVNTTRKHYAAQEDQRRKSCQKYSPAKGKKGTGAPVAWLVRIQTGCGLEPASYKRHSLIISYPAAGSGELLLRRDHTWLSGIIYNSQGVPGLNGIRNQAV